MGDAQDLNAALLVEGVSAGYNSAPALRAVSFTVPAGMRVAVVGPNGAGKSTLFKAIAGLLPLQAGRVRVRGRDPQQGRAEISYVAQQGELDLSFPVTVTDVVMMGRTRHVGWLRWPSRRDRQAVWTALDKVGVRDLAQRQIGELSGGQRQRVLIARSLAQEAGLLLLDEPFAGVDAVSEQAILGLLDQLDADGVTVLLATHDLNLAADRFDRVLLLNKEVVAYGPSQQVFCPDLLRAAYGGQLAVWEHERGLLMLGDGHCGEVRDT